MSVIIGKQIPYLIMHNSNPIPEIRIATYNSPDLVPVYINPLIMPVWDDDKGADLPRLPYFPFSGSGEDQSYSDYLSLKDCLISPTTSNGSSSSDHFNPRF